MADTLPETDFNLLDNLGKLLADHKGADVVVLDIRQESDWADYFVIATGMSNTHLDGLERHVKEFCRQNDIEILRKSRKPALAQTAEDEWRLIDLGRTVIHLMSERARGFYELERLWTNPKL